MSRAWFGIIFVPPLFCIPLITFYMFATIVMTMFFVSFMFLVIMFIVYFDYMLSIVGLSSCSCISSYNALSKDPWMGGRHCVSVVLIRCLPADSPYIPGHVVDHGCDTPVESFVVHSPNVGARRMWLRRKTSSVINLS